LVLDVLEYGCPRLQASRCIDDTSAALIAAGAWVELSLFLIERELPDWGVHRISRDDRRWNCSVCVQGLAMNWLDDIVEFQHESLALAIYGALVQAQIRKLDGTAPSNVTPFRRPRLDHVQQGGR
jgi:hypothetical protein